MNEVLPHEAALTQFLRRHWRNETRIHDTAPLGLPGHTSGFAVAVARQLRNLMTDR